VSSTPSFERLETLLQHSTLFASVFHGLFRHCTLFCVAGWVRPERHLPNMPVNYSKWDAIELSDDSDFEPHPNVDKKSFIRAKQAQIHQQRAERTHRIDTLKYERLINDGLLRRIDTLLADLKENEATAQDSNQFLFQALIRSAGDPDDDEPPKPPHSVHEKAEPIKYSQMMGSLVDQVKKEVDDAKTVKWAAAYVKGVESHKKKVLGLQKDLQVELDRLEKEASSKITSNDIKEGFSSSHINSNKKAAPGSSSGSTAAVELLNPAAKTRKDELLRQESAGASSGAEADVDEDGSNLAIKSEPPADDDEVDTSSLAKRFAQIKMGDYKADLQFISANRGILDDKEQDGLLMLAFDEQLKGHGDFAKQCVHQSLLVQYCKALGQDGVGVFFRRITTPGHQALKVFMDDVNSTYSRIKTRTAEIIKEKANDPNPDQIEQIQLQAVEPGTEIHFNIPRPGATEEVEKQARAIFDTFPPGLQRALESGSLDRVNEVLGKMSVEEAEEIVEHLGESGMLDMRQGVIDGTTAEGQEELKRMHANVALDEQQTVTDAVTAVSPEIADPD